MPTISNTGLSHSVKVIITLILGATLTIVAAWRSHQQEVAGKHAQFISQARQQASALQNTVRLYSVASEAFMLALQGHQFNREDFHLNAAKISVILPAVKAVEWIANAPQVDRNVLEKSLQENISPNFRIHAIEGGLGKVDSERETLRPILFASPEDIEQKLTGADLSSLPGLNAVLTQSMTNGLTTTSMVTFLLRSDADYQGEIRLLKPAVPGDKNRNTADSFFEEGFFSIVIDLQKLISEATDDQNRSLELDVFDLGQHSTQAIFSSEAASGSKTEKSGLTKPIHNSATDWIYRDTLSWPQREWLIRIRPPSDNKANRQIDYQTVSLFIVGILISIVLALLIARKSSGK